jgi:hypothetical protein
LGNAIAAHGFVQDAVVETGEDVLVHAAYATRFCGNYIPQSSPCSPLARS